MTVGLGGGPRAGIIRKATKRHGRQTQKIHVDTPRNIVLSVDLIHGPKIGKVVPGRIVYQIGIAFPVKLNSGATKFLVQFTKNGRKSRKGVTTRSVVIRQQMQLEGEVNDGGIVLGPVHGLQKALPS